MVYRCGNSAIIVYQSKYAGTALSPNSNYLAGIVHIDICDSLAFL
jgi:hypothetical protein